MEMYNSISPSKMCKPLFTNKEKEDAKKLFYAQYKVENEVLVTALEGAIIKSVEHLLQCPSWESRRNLERTVEALVGLCENYLEEQWNLHLDNLQEIRSILIHYN